MPKVNRRRYEESICGTRAANGESPNACLFAYEQMSTLDPIKYIVASKLLYP